MRDEESLAIMKKFCGHYHSEYTESIPNFVSLPKINDRYGRENLYCRWDLINFIQAKYILFNFTKMVQLSLYRIHIILIFR
jgi:hypothetical protein